MGHKSCVESIGWQKNQEQLKEKWKKYRKEKEKEYYKNPIICEYCKKPIPYTKDLRNRAFCNSSCSATFNNLRKEKKERDKIKCINCGNKVNGKAKKYCSKNCQKIYEKNKRIKNWKEGKLKISHDGIPPYIREYLFEKHDNKCSKCGWAEINQYTGKIPLEVHHTDGNYLNHDEKNLELLCPNCHSLTPTKGSLNKGNGRRNRKICRAKFNAKLKLISSGSNSSR